MGKRFITVFLTGALIVGMIGISYSNPGYMSQFNTNYGTSGTALNSCSVCHTSPPTLNPYGNDWLNSAYNFAAIEGLDSDKDGFTNIVEIQARTFPGDAASHPAAAGDTTPPTVTGFTLPPTAAALTVSILAFTATDNVGVTGYIVTESATAPAAAAAGWSAAPPSSYAFGTAGTKTLYAWAKDAAGNVSASLSASVTVTIATPDTTPPTVTGFSIPATATRLTVTITTFTATDNVGVAGYLLTESATAPAAAAAGWSPAPQSFYRFASAGGKTLYAWAKDAAGNVSTSLSASVNITLSGTPTGPAALGIYRGGEWYWDNNGNGIWDGCAVDSCKQSFGSPDDIPVAGDWTGDGIKKIGVYRKGSWYLDLNNNGVWDGCGVDACIASFGGLLGDVPVVGDWTGDGIAKVGIYRKGEWFLDLNGNGVWDGCGVDGCIASFGGLLGDVPVVGDWTGDGIVKVGIYRKGEWFKDLNGNGVWDGCGVDGCIASFGGLPEDVPVVGDWTGDGIAKLGIYRRGEWYHDLNNNGVWDGCGVDGCVASFGGNAADIPFAGQVSQPVPVAGQKSRPIPDE